jgi:hypothetical protein
VPSILQPELYRWNPFVLPWLILGAALWTLAAVIFHRQRGSRVAVLFCGMIVLVGVWFGAFAAMFAAAHAGVATVWARIGMAGISLLPATIYDFTSTALRLPRKRAGITRALWLVCTIFAAISLFSRGIVAGVLGHPWGW